MHQAAVATQDFMETAADVPAFEPAFAAWAGKYRLFFPKICAPVLVLSVRSVNLDLIWNLQATVACVNCDRGTSFRYRVFDAGVPGLELLTEPLDNRAPTHTKISVNGHDCRFEVV